MIIDDKLHFGIGIFELWQASNYSSLSYEKFIKKLGKQVYNELNNVLNLNLPEPNKFYTFKNIVVEKKGCVKGEENRIGKSVSARICFRYKSKNKRKIKKIEHVKIGHTVAYNYTLFEFINNIGHEMVHYYDLLENKRIPLDHGKKFQKIMVRWNKKLKSYGIKIKDGSITLGEIDRN